MDLLEAISTYVKVRDKKKELQDQHKNELAPLNQALDGLEAVILQFFNESGQNSAQTDAGTAYTTTRESYTVEDPVMFRGWVHEQDDLSFFEARASKEKVSSWFKETGELPPGIKYSADITIGVRRA